MPTFTLSLTPHHTSTIYALMIEWAGRSCQVLFCLDGECSVSVWKRGQWFYETSAVTAGARGWTRCCHSDVSHVKFMRLSGDKTSQFPLELGARRSAGGIPVSLLMLWECIFTESQENLHNELLKSTVVSWEFRYALCGLIFNDLICYGCRSFWKCIVF